MTPTPNEKLREEWKKMVENEKNFTKDVATETADWWLSRAIPKAEVRSLIVGADSMLSLLRHRGGINFGSMGLPQEYEVDQVIGKLRRYSELLSNPQDR